MANQGKRRDDEDGEHESNGERSRCVAYVFIWLVKKSKYQVHQLSLLKFSKTRG